MPGVTFFCIFVQPETNRKGGGNHPLGRTRVKPVLKCKQVDNNNLQNIYKRSKFSKKKKQLFMDSEN